MKYLIEESDNVVRVTPNEGEVKVYSDARLIEKKRGVVIIQNDMAKTPIDYFENSEIDKLELDDQEK